MKNFDLNSSPWNRLQELDKQIEELQKEREQISRNLGTTRTPIGETRIEVKPLRNNGSGNVYGNQTVPTDWTIKTSSTDQIVVRPPGEDSKGIPWGWIIAIVIILLILAGQGKNEQPNNQPVPTQPAPAQTN